MSTPEGRFSMFGNAIRSVVAAGVLLALIPVLAVAALARQAAELLGR